MNRLNFSVGLLELVSQLGIEFGQWQFDIGAVELRKFVLPHSVTGPNFHLIEDLLILGFGLLSQFV